MKRRGEKKREETRRKEKRREEKRRKEKRNEEKRREDGGIRVYEEEIEFCEIFENVKSKLQCQGKLQTDKQNMYI